LIEGNDQYPVANRRVTQACRPYFPAARQWTIRQS
jgi:hypothetical protein